MEKKVVSAEENKILKKMFWNSHLVFSNFNMTKMEANGFTMTMAPAVESIYGDDIEGKKAAYARHQSFFNTHAVAFNFIAGLCYALEKDCHDGKVPGETIDAIKASLMGPTAGMFDSIFFNCLRVIGAGIAIGLCSQGNILGTFIFILLYGISQSLLKWVLLKLGYTLGTSFIDTVFNSGLMSVATRCASILGLMMVGAMTATTVGFPLNWTLNIGETSIVSRTGGATTFAMGMANFLKSYLGGHDSMAFWYHFAIMFEALFILTTVDNGTRVARYQIGEMLGNVRKLKKFADPTWKPGNIITTLIATALWGGLLWMGVSDANGGINAMVPIFGISNQLLAAACFVLITVCVAKMGYWKHLWIPVVPLVWDIAVTFTADFQKIFGPLSYFTTASKYQAQIDSGELTGEALANAKAALSNAYLDGVLSVFFLVMMGVFVVVGIVVVARTFAAGKYGAETTSEEPFVESQWFAPSSLVATALEKKVQREYSAKLHELVRNGQVAA